MIINRETDLKLLNLVRKLIDLQKQSDAIMEDISQYSPGQQSSIFELNGIGYRLNKASAPRVMALGGVIPDFDSKH